ncbi:MAG: hypothetical protein ACFB4I_00325 [Cyanophyceae cyanobacterium]
MGRKIGQIQQELTALEESSTAVETELNNLYEQYLNLLGQAARKQIALACYQVCTQIYPQSFLALTLRQREELQENLRRLGEQIHDELSLLRESEPEDSQELNIMEKLLEELPTDSSLSAAEELGATEELASEDESEEEASFDEVDDADREKNPENLSRWQKKIEQKIDRTLTDFSVEVNRLLQRAKILPDQLPPKLVEVAMSEEASAVSSPPNLLHLLVEAENERSQKSTVAKITAIRLRRSEIEFSEPGLTTKRQKIRRLAERIRQLRQQYRRLRREYAIAEAEAAWRASWFDR